MEPTDLQVFYIGQKVECKDEEEEDWKLGEVVSLDPLLIQPDGWDKKFPWDEVRIPAKENSENSEADDLAERPTQQDETEELPMEDEAEENTEAELEAEAEPAGREEDTLQLAQSDGESPPLSGIHAQIKEQMRQRKLKRLAEKGAAPQNGVDVQLEEPLALPETSMMATSETHAMHANNSFSNDMSSNGATQARAPSNEDVAHLRYCVTGSWTDWNPADMEWDEKRKLFVFEVFLGSEGWESFQILFDGDYNKCLHPDREDACPYEFFNLCGPDDRGHGLNWTIGAHEKDHGAPGAQYEIQLHVTMRGAVLSVDWKPVQVREEEAPLKLFEASDLPEMSSVSPDDVPMPSLESFLDGQQDKLGEVLAPIRAKEVAKVESLMQAYDRSKQFPRFQDAQYWNRDQYEAHLRGEALKVIRTTVNRYKTQGSTAQLWKITGGRDKGGVVVRNGCEMSSTELPTRLSHHALVEQVDLQDTRLHYKLLSGEGPQEGWVTTRVLQQGGLKNLAVRTTRQHWDQLYGTPGDSQIPAPPQLVLVALMAVHISTAARLERFQYVLRSIEQQSLPYPADELEFVVGLSWSSVSPELEASVETALDAFTSSRQGLTIVVGQKERHSQFQHFAAALHAVEESLSKNMSNALSGSIWFIFGDDDDLWHSERVAQYVQAIHGHPVLDAVGLFATTARVNCGSGVTHQDMPINEEEVEPFIASGRGSRTDLEDASQAWFKRLRAAGNNAATIPYQDDLGMEYFHLCPRLRVVQEFFTTTSKSILAHRYCDLRFAEYLLSYPRFGVELGLEVSWFEPSCWMYFYACPQAAEGQWDRSIECKEDEVDNLPPETVGIEGHMATEVKVEKADIEMAGKSIRDFKSYDAGITQQRLTRYWAAFRNYMELSIIPRHRGKLDQRVFDGCIYMAVNNSFGQFADRVTQMPESRRGRAAMMMFKAGQAFATSLAKTFEVGVLWHFPNQFMEPSVEHQNALTQNPVPNYTVQPQQPQFAWKTQQQQQPQFVPGSQGYPGQHFGHQQPLTPWMTQKNNWQSPGVGGYGVNKLK